MSSPLFTRRAMIVGTGTVVASGALAPSYVNAVHASDVCFAPFPAESVTDKIDRLSRELSLAMRGYGNGEWRVVVAADDNITLQPSIKGSAHYRAQLYLEQYRKASMEADPSIIGWDASYSVETGSLNAIIARRA